MIGPLSCVDYQTLQLALGPFEDTENPIEYGMLSSDFKPLTKLLLIF